MAPARTEPAGERPVIGVSAWLETARVGNFLEEPVAFTEATFVGKLSAAGADTVILPVQPHLPAELVRRLDGLVIVGGPDVQSPRYVTVRTQPRRPEVGRRDAFELALSSMALEEKIPILGVCRGCQVLNVIAGGTLVPEVTERFEGVVHTYWEPDSSECVEFARHRVEADPGSPIGKALGSSFEVLSSHHQAVDRLAPCFRPAAHTADGLLEGFYDPDHPFAVGIQWHPEAEDGVDQPLFAAFAEAARRYRSDQDRG